MFPPACFSIRSILAVASLSSAPAIFPCRITHDVAPSRRGLESHQASFLEKAALALESRTADMDFVSPDVGCPGLALSGKPQYKYQQLPPGDFIRYLILHPGKGDEPLACSLKVSLLDQAPQFEAISYVWGTSMRDQAIECDGKRLYITANLSDALRCVRWPRKPRKLWADSICIDQANTREQGHQVAIMGRIYRNAKRVLIHLGSQSHGHEDDAVALISDVNAMICRAFDQIDMSSWDSFPYPEPDDPLLLDSRWPSFSELLRRPWFSRGWVLQEAGLAAQATVLWGCARVDWLKLVRVYVWVGVRALQVGLTHGIEFREPFLDIYFDGLRANEGRVFLPSSTNYKVHLLAFLDGANSTLDLKDPRDRIYAFLGLAEQLTGAVFVMTPNYESHFLNVYLSFACQYLLSTGDLSLLNYVTHDEESLGAPLPSWVPRWDKTPPLHKLCHPGVSERLCSPTSLETSPRILPNHILQVRAVILDSIQYESGIFPSSPHAAEVAMLWRNLPNSPGRYQEPFILASCLGCLPRLAAFLRCLFIGRYLGYWDNWVPAVAAYIRRLQKAGAQFTKDDLGNIEEESAIGDVALVGGRVRVAMGQRRFIVTSRGYFGLISGYQAINLKSDVCCIIYGAMTPVILRKTGKDGYYKLLGELYIQGEGDDQFGSPADRPWLDWSVKEEDIFLV